MVEPWRVIEMINGGLDAQDLTELGSVLTASGYTAAETRAMVADVQEASAQIAVITVPKVLERAQRIHREQFEEAHRRIQALQSWAGWISKDTVLAILRSYR